MPVYLLLAVVVIFACVLLNRVSNKLGIPMLLAFILLGMFFGSDGLFKIPFDNYSFAEQLCSAALIFIIFYGGFGTNWKKARSVAAQAVLLSTVGVVATAGLVGVFCRFALGLGWAESFLLASVIASTDAASVFSILRSRRLNLRDNTASLLEVESGSNDPFSYMLTMIFITIVGGGNLGGKLIYEIFAQLFYGAAFGAAISFVAPRLLRRFKFGTAGFDAVFVVGIALLSYAAPAALGGNGYLSAYIVGIVLGNTEIPNKKSLVHFFDGVTGLMQMLIFFLLGLLAFPSRMIAVAIPALLVGLFLTFVARPVAVTLILSPFHKKLNQQFIVAWSGLRGAASIVFAIMAKLAVDTESDIFHIVFFIVLLSILFQGTLIPVLSKKLGMIDDSDDVMKTFNDYSEEVPVRFVQFSIPEGHAWCGRTLKDIELPPNTLAVLLLRNGENVIPNGSTRLSTGDKVILSAEASENADGIRLSELKVSSDGEYAGKTLSEIPVDGNSLVIMILRGKKTLIPRGDSVLLPGDVLVLNRPEA